jgi:hypothetical protein
MSADFSVSNIHVVIYIVTVQTIYKVIESLHDTKLKQNSYNSIP